MKKNLVLAFGVMAALSLLACKEKPEDKPSDDGNSDDVVTVACSAVTADSFKDGCIKCSVNGSADVLVCGVCEKADAATDSANFSKNVCVSSVEGAKAFAQTLVCDEIVENKFFYYEYKTTTCSDNEVCTNGFCKLDESLLDACAKKTYTCEGDVLKTTVDDACSDKEDLDLEDFDCSNFGGCVAAEGTCKAFVSEGTCTEIVKKAECVTMGKDENAREYLVQHYYDTDCGEDGYKETFCEKGCVNNACVADSNTDSNTDTEDGNSEHVSVEEIED